MNKNIENPHKEPRINDFMQQYSAILSKWAAEGNIDSERDVANNIKIHVENGDITPAEGISQLQGIDSSRIER